MQMSQTLYARLLYVIMIHQKFNLFELKRSLKRKRLILWILYVILKLFNAVSFKASEMNRYPFLSIRQLKMTEILRHNFYIDISSY